MLDAQSRRGGVPSSWLSFGMELSKLGLQPEEEAALDFQALAALRAARALESRPSVEPSDAQKALGLPSRQPSMPGTSWLQFGLELCAPEFLGPLQVFQGAPHTRLGF